MQFVHCCSFSSSGIELYSVMYNNEFILCSNISQVRSMTFCIYYTYSAHLFQILVSHTWSIWWSAAGRRVLRYPNTLLNLWISLMYVYDLYFLHYSYHNFPSYLERIKEIKPHKTDFNTVSLPPSSEIEAATEMWAVKCPFKGIYLGVAFIQQWNDNGYR